MASAKRSRLPNFRAAAAASAAVASAAAALARLQQPVAVGDHEEAPLDAIGIPLVQQPLRAAEPAFGRAELAPESEAHADPESTARRGLHLARLQVKMMRALVGGDPFFVPTEHVRGSREQPEIRRSERLQLVRASEQRIRVAPGAGRVRVASPLECAPGLPCPRHRRHEPNALRRERRVGAA